MGKSSLVLIGGTGFIGSSFLKKAVDSGKYEIVLITRKDAKSIATTLESLGINSKFITIVERFDLLDATMDISARLAKHLGVRPVEGVINLAGVSVGKGKEIYGSNIRITQSVIKVYNYFLSSNKDLFLVNLGSVAEDYEGFVVPPYEKSKADSFKLIERNVKRFVNIKPVYVKGKGKDKMRDAAQKLISLYSYFPEVLSRVKVSVVDVEDLSDVIMAVVGNIQRIKKNRSYYIKNTDLALGELLFSLIGKRYEERNEVNRLRTLVLKSIVFVGPVLYKNEYAFRVLMFSKLAIGKKTKNTLLLDYGKCKNWKKLGIAGKIFLDDTNRDGYILCKRDKKEIIKRIEEGAKS